MSPPLQSSGSQGEAPSEDVVGPSPCMLGGFRPLGSRVGLRAGLHKCPCGSCRRPMRCPAEGPLWAAPGPANSWNPMACVLPAAALLLCPVWRPKVCCGGDRASETLPGPGRILGGRREGNEAMGAPSSLGTDVKAQVVRQGQPGPPSRTAGRCDGCGNLVALCTVLADKPSPLHSGLSPLVAPNVWLLLSLLSSGPRAASFPLSPAVPAACTPGAEVEEGRRDARWAQPVTPTPPSLAARARQLQLPLWGAQSHPTSVPSGTAAAPHLPKSFS